MQNDMELDGFRQAPVNDDGNYFPEHPHKSYSMVLAYALGDKYYVVPSALHFQLPCRKR